MDERASTATAGRPVPAAECAAIRDFVALFANRLRLKLLCILTRRRACVNELMEATGEKQSNVSQQLKLLYEAGLVGRRRSGARVYYEIADPVAVEVVNFLLAAASRPRRRRRQPS